MCPSGRNMSAIKIALGIKPPAFPLKSIIKPGHFSVFVSASINSVLKSELIKLEIWIYPMFWSRTSAFMFLILISSRGITAVSLFLPLKISRVTDLPSSPLITEATSLTDFPATFAPSTFIIISPALSPFCAAGVPSTTLIIITLPEVEIIFTPIPTIFASMLVVCSRYSFSSRNFE